MSYCFEIYDDFCRKTQSFPVPMLICFGILCAPFELKKAMMSRYHVVKNLMVLHSFRQYHNVTDGRTEISYQYRASLCWRTIKTTVTHSSGCSVTLSSGIMCASVSTINCSHWCIAVLLNVAFCALLSVWKWNRKPHFEVAALTNTGSTDAVERLRGAAARIWTCRCQQTAGGYWTQSIIVRQNDWTRSVQCSKLQQLHIRSPYSRRSCDGLTSAAGIQFRLFGLCRSSRYLTDSTHLMRATSETYRSCCFAALSECCGSTYLSTGIRWHFILHSA